jgi:hypothetical protein
MISLFIDHGRVNCPRFGDLDIDHCLACPDLVDVRVEDGHEVVVCGARSSMSRLPLRTLFGR